MLRILLEHIGQEIPNTRLPVSTYAQNKNELLGKIILPFRKITEKHF